MLPSPPGLAYTPAPLPHSLRCRLSFAVTSLRLFSGKPDAFPRVSLENDRKNSLQESGRTFEKKKRHVGHNTPPFPCLQACPTSAPACQTPVSSSPAACNHSTKLPAFPSLHHPCHCEAEDNAGCSVLFCKKACSGHGLVLSRTFFVQTAYAGATKKVFRVTI